MIIQFEINEDIKNISDLSDLDIRNQSKYFTLAAFLLLLHALLPWLDWLLHVCLRAFLRGDGFGLWGFCFRYALLWIHLSLRFSLLYCLGRYQRLLELLLYLRMRRISLILWFFVVELLLRHVFFALGLIDYDLFLQLDWLLLWLLCFWTDFFLSYLLLMHSLYLFMSFLINLMRLFYLLLCSEHLIILISQTVCRIFQRSGEMLCKRLFQRFFHPWFIVFNVFQSPLIRFRRPINCLFSPHSFWILCFFVDIRITNSIMPDLWHKIANNCRNFLRNIWPNNFIGSFFIKMSVMHNLAFIDKHFKSVIVFQFIKFWCFLCFDFRYVRINVSKLSITNFWFNWLLRTLDSWLCKPFCRFLFMMVTLYSLQLAFIPNLHCLYLHKVIVDLINIKIFLSALCWYSKARSQGTFTLNLWEQVILLVHVARVCKHWN